MQIAEVAYREGEVGILELLDAVRDGVPSAGFAPSIYGSMRAWRKSPSNAR